MDDQEHKYREQELSIEILQNYSVLCANSAEIAAIFVQVISKGSLSGGPFPSQNAGRPLIVAEGMRTSFCGSNPAAGQGAPICIQICEKAVGVRMRFVMLLTICSNA
jgi:hypothetical protein